MVCSIVTSQGRRAVSDDDAGIGNESKLHTSSIMRSIANPIERLSEQAYWDQVHARSKQQTLLRRWAAQVLSPSLFDFYYHGGYVTFLADEIIRPHIPTVPGHRPSILEIGSAPGTNIAKMSRRFGCDAWGVEYTQTGVDQNRSVFVDHGFDPAHVVHADAFSRDFRERYKGHFDVVVSNGFIEHFSRPEDAIDVHLELLRRGGLLIVSIPNLLGLNYLLHRFFNAPVLAMHNLEIMERQRFAELFEARSLVPKYCDYLGVFAPGLFNAPSRSLREVALELFKLGSYPWDYLQRAIFGEAPPKLAWSSPYLLYVGQLETH